MKKLSLLIINLIFCFCSYSQDNLELNKEYETIGVDTVQLYSELYHLDSLQTKLGFVYLGGFIGLGGTSIVLGISTTQLLIPSTIIFSIWIGTNIYFRIKTARIEKLIIKSRLKN